MSSSPYTKAKNTSSNSWKRCFESVPYFFSRKMNSRLESRSI